MPAINRDAIDRLRSPEVRAVARKHWARLLDMIGLSPREDGEGRHPPHAPHAPHRQPAGGTSEHHGRQLGEGMNRAGARVAARHAEWDGVLLRGLRRFRLRD